jgi:hypothetical protein
MAERISRKVLFAGAAGLASISTVSACNKPVEITYASIEVDVDEDIALYDEIIHDEYELFARELGQTCVNALSGAVSLKYSIVDTYSGNDAASFAKASCPNELNDEDLADVFDAFDNTTNELTRVYRAGYLDDGIWSEKEKADFRKDEVDRLVDIYDVEASK